VYGNNFLVVALAVLRMLKGLVMKTVLKKNVAEQVQGDCTFEFAFELHAVVSDVFGL